ncbi:DBF4-type zinc finger-containing protein 2 isoform X1 [Chiloscyllium plagiosum]|uniref:DBF4-type zinc finger-containing protein 2 isoform X1 n=2 Tax=Chiloscyllium plagiosum TaxID=36176 RepID=UPI001CB81BA6|nr:DBF4-type zinc finger-containing protein 2 isoform X1 [Chiloscyllium plagiosum]XP_043549261.1 DBF4-type zinc finger-containing protein 2 isoform X1 [Chiloscyllium plagiosum]
MNDSASGDGPHQEQPIPETFSKQSRRGYCGCCKELYTCLEQHLQTIRHRQFASESRNQGPAKSLMERFLQDVIQYHPSRYKDNRSTYMDLPSINAPLLPRKELADIHSCQDDKETIGTREELPSTDNESIRSAHLMVGKNAAVCSRAKASVSSPMPIGASLIHKDATIKETVYGEHVIDISSPTPKGIRRAAFLGVSEGILSYGKVDRHGHRIGLGLYRPTPRKGIKDHDKTVAVIQPRCEQRENWSPAQMNFPNVSSGPALRFSRLHNVNSQGTVAGSPLPQLRDYTGASSPRCAGGPSQAEECRPQNRSTVTCLSTLKEAKIVDRIEDLVSETIETVIQNYCNRQVSQSQESDSENSAAEVKGMPTYCQLEKKRKVVETGLQGSLPGRKWPLEGEHHPGVTLNSNDAVCNRQAVRDTASCFKKMLSLSLSSERKAGGQQPAASEDGSSGGSICSLGSHLGHLKSTSSSEWDTSVKVEKDCSRIANKDLELLTDTQITLEDRGYKTQLSSVLHFQPEECDKMEEENPAHTANGVKVEQVETRPQPLEGERKLRSLPYVPASFAGKTWSEIMAEDDLKVEALVKEFKEGRYLCYFDSESLANRGKKQRKKHQAGNKDPSQANSKASAETARGLPQLQEGNDEAELEPGPCKPEPGKKPGLRHCRLASRCQVVKVSHGTQTSEAGYPVVKKKSRRVEQEPENVWAGGEAEAEERPGAKARLCSVRLPRAYSKIMSPVQPRTVIYVLSSPDFASATRAACHEGKRTSKASDDGASPAKYKYKKSPVRYYDPATNRIVKTPPGTHHVRQLFRSLSPDINMGQFTEKPRLKAAGGVACAAAALPHPGNNQASGLWPTTATAASSSSVKERPLGESPGSECPSKSTGTASSSRQTSLSRSLLGSDGGLRPPPPAPPQRRCCHLLSEAKSGLLSPLRKETPESPFGKLQVYVGPRSRRPLDKEGPRQASGVGQVAGCEEEEEENGEGGGRENGPVRPTLGPRPSLRGASSHSDMGPPTTSPPPSRRPRLRPASRDITSGRKVVRREAEVVIVPRQSPRQAARKRK